MDVKTTPRRSFSVWLLIGLHLFLGIGAVFGGAVLVIEPSGSLLGMPTDIMEIELFPDYLIPGIILLVFMGIFPLIVAWGLITRRECKWAERLNVFKKSHWSWAYSLYISIILIIWISVETYILNAVALVHLFYIGLGLAIQIVTVLPQVNESYLKERVENEIEIEKDSVQG
ncbi:hypothetical protein M3201_24825 [Paenibacillus motobuensis]|nr:MULTISPECIES: hypothetical protein [Paenibacillus]MCM3042887.1 hypothetical protein [Paenibacillus lutimineralis]MCM3649991.1 hypothetical protein [Paenibacillus motobuensis]